MTTGVAPCARSGSRSTLWKGTDRYEILRIVGEGGMGVVYEANDRERGQRVALKLLQNFSPEALYLFKQEFRTLADVRHRNLVRLHELAVDGDQVFFTMELVLGTDVLSYVRSKVVALGRSSSEHPTRYMTPPDGRRDDAPSRAQTTAQTVAPDLDRLRPTFCQLVEGIRALHAAGKLHRDIKPSNVLVTNDGRVVLLDFGVATELSLAGQPEGTGEPRIVGTVAYMAPEQAGGDPLSTASDWYSLGVILYEALSGRPPFEGPMADVITLKCILDPPPPSAFATEIPEDLDLLCRELLDIDPDKRPGGPRSCGASP